MTSSVPLRQLAEWLRAEIAQNTDTAVLAGHYAIFSAGGTAVDFLNGDDAHPAASAEMIAFTKFSWSTACDALAADDRRRARLLVLVDDVTFMRPLAGDTHIRERLGDALATQYLGALPTLPAFHREELAAHALDDSRMLKHADARWVFSERELRVAHVRRLKAVLRSGSAKDMLTASNDESEITVKLSEYGDHCLVHSGRTNCAGGYLELLASLHDRGIRRLVALVPMRCLAPIAVGTSLAKDLFSLHDLSVVNVAVPDALSDAPVAVIGGSVFGVRGSAE